MQSFTGLGWCLLGPIISDWWTQREDPVRRRRRRHPQPRHTPRLWRNQCHDSLSQVWPNIFDNGVATCHTLRYQDSWQYCDGQWFSNRCSSGRSGDLATCKHQFLWMWCFRVLKPVTNLLSIASGRWLIDNYSFPGCSSVRQAAAAPQDEHSQGFNLFLSPEYVFAGTLLYLSFSLRKLPGL